MDFVNKSVEFLKQNWITIILLITVLIIFLKSFANYLVDIAKLTPEKNDDLKAAKFKAHVQAFIKFLKSLFKIKENKK